MLAFHIFEAILQGKEIQILGKKPKLAGFEKNSTVQKHFIHTNYFEKQ